MTNRKNRILTILMIAFLSAAQWAGAQKTYFVYLQSDNQQQFTVNISGKNIASTSMGYVILPKLHDSTYAIKIAFPGGAAPQQEFDLVVNGNDMGFLLKNFGEKGYGLFNLQSLAVVMNANDANRQKALALQQEVEEKKKADSVAAVTAVIEKQRTDSIQEAAVLLAQKQTEDSLQQVAKQQAADTVKTTAVKPAENILPAVVAPVVATTAAVSSAANPVSPAKTDSLAAQVASEKADSIIQKSPVKDSTANLVADILAPNKAVAAVVVAETVKDSVRADTTQKPAAIVAVPAIAKNDSTAAPKFLNMEITDSTAQFLVKKDSVAPVKTDSVSIAPVAVTAAVAAPKTDAAEAKLTTDTAAVKTEIPVAKAKTESREPVATITSNNPNTVIVTAPVVAAGTPPVVTEKAGIVVTNNCKKIASEKDFNNLRKKLIGGTDDAAKILEAKSAFREKCYTNDQLRNLCVLFLDDASRLRFLDEAYPYSTDPQDYKQLGNLLTDSFYQRRFNAIIK